jgi:hypothetical protein
MRNPLAVPALDALSYLTHRFDEVRFSQAQTCKTTASFMIGFLSMTRINYLVSVIFA